MFLAPSAEGTTHGETFRQLANFAYLTGLELPRSVLAIEPDGATILFAPPTDRRFENPARRNDFPGRRLAGDPEIARRAAVDGVRSLRELPAALADWHARGLGIRLDPGRAGAMPPLTPSPTRDTHPIDELRRFLAATRPEVEIGSAHAEVAAVRMVKSQAEIELLRRACAITAEGMRAAARAVGPGVDERTLEGVMEAEWKRLGSQRRAFDSIVKSGPNSLWPWRILAAHSDRRNRAMQSGELVIFDVGCELDRLRQPTSAGRFPACQAASRPEQRRRLELSDLRGRRGSSPRVRPGVTLGRAAAQVALAARSRPRTSAPTCRPACSSATTSGSTSATPAWPTNAAGARGMIFTVEPWYYDHEDGIAVFVEDVVLVTTDGAENLTAELPRDPDELERLVGTPQRLRVLTYNVRHGAGMDGRVDLTRAAAVIERYRPDVVTLQEIDVGCGRTDGIDQVRRLGQLCGMHACFGEFMPFDGGHYGMALLSKHPVESCTNHRLPDGREPRSTLAATIRIRGASERLVVAGIHLYATEAERLAQAERLIELFGAHELPVVLAGDFNSRPGSVVMDRLGDVWEVVSKQGAADTFPADAPDHEIDFVLVPKGGSWRAIECRVGDEPLVSDHRPVSCVLERR